MRGQTFNWTAIGRALLVTLVGTLLVFVAVRLVSSGKPAPHDAHISANATAVEQRRCQALRLAAEQDAACQALWARDRARFLGQPDTPAVRGRP